VGALEQTTVRLTEKFLGLSFGQIFVIRTHSLMQLLKESALEIFAVPPKITRERRQEKFRAIDAARPIPTTLQTILCTICFTKQRPCVKVTAST
jgi:hypothetical protein